FAVPKALNQILGRYVDKLDCIGTVKNRVRDGFAYSNMSDLRHDVVEALDVLDIERRVDVDALIQQLLDVEIALRMTATCDIGMGKFVDEDDLRMPRQDGIEVHLLDPLAFVIDPLTRDDFEIFEERLGLLTAVGLHYAHNDVIAVLLSRPGLLQHLIGFAEARSCTHEYLQRPEASFLTSGRFKQGFRRRALVLFAPLFCHSALSLCGLRSQQIIAWRCYLKRDLVRAHSHEVRRRDRECAPRHAWR